jgi:hypothetical protein
MEHFDTVLIGSGYSSVGFAVARQRCLIVEEQEMADTHFYLPLRSYRYHPYTPKTREGERLARCFELLSLFGGAAQNTNGFECALCRFLEETPVPLLLKTRVVRREDLMGDTVLTLSTNGGLMRVSCRRVIDTRSAGHGGYLSVLILAESEEDARTASKALGWPMERAYYEGQYHLRAPITEDENAAKCHVHEALAGARGVRLLSIAPVFAREGGGLILSDDDHLNPIAAFEAGYRLGKEVAK